LLKGGDFHALEVDSRNLGWLDPCLAGGNLCDLIQLRFQQSQASDRWVREATGRELTLGGDIRLKIGFIPALVIIKIVFM
jgi:hypothetical protein